MFTSVDKIKMDAMLVVAKLLAKFKEAKDNASEEDVETLENVESVFEDVGKTLNDL